MTLVHARLRPATPLAPIVALVLASFACGTEEPPATDAREPAPGADSGPSDAPDGSATINTDSAAGHTSDAATPVPPDSAPPHGHVLFGLNPEERGDDAAVIRALGGTPFPESDPSGARKNAIVRMELLTGRTYDLERRYHGLSFDGWPDDYDRWTAREGRTLLMTVTSVSTRTFPLLRIPFYEVAHTSMWDATIDDIADRMRAFVDETGPERLYFGWTHEPGHAEYRLSLTVTAAAPTGATTLEIQGRPGIGLVKSLATGTVLDFGSGVRAVVASPAAVGATSVAVEPLPAAVLAGSSSWLQSVDEWKADYRASYRKFRDRIERRWGTWPGASRFRWVWILFQDAFVRGADWYPGDEYVDVVGLDAYNNYGGRTHGRPSNPWRDFADIAAPFRAFAVEHGKGTIIGELGVLEGVRIGPVGGSFGPGDVTIDCTPLLADVQAGDEVEFFDAAGDVQATATVESSAPAGAARLSLRGLSSAVGEGAPGASRPPGTSKSSWLETTRAELAAWPELEGVVYYLGAAERWWIERPPEGSASSLLAYRAWGRDPRFGGPGSDAP